jgi:uncharacterized lipoprotein NlpE involved in copper resistance
MKRLIFIIITIGAISLLLALMGCQTKEEDMKIWHTIAAQDSTSQEVSYFVQPNLDASQVANKQIKARIEGEWTDLEVSDFPQSFVKWNFQRRLEQLKEIKEGLETGNMRMPTLSGPHNGMVATHGNKRKDAIFSINNAVKGMGWLPKAEKIKEVKQMLLDTWEEDIFKKLDVLTKLYEQGEEIFDMSKQTSLELYSHPGYETQSFLNQMADPGVTIVFLDLPESYKLKSIVQMIDPNNPNLTEYEKDVVDYINLVHDYIHGQMPRKSIGVVYHAIQVYDNSPKGKGKLISPMFP